nr:MAG TPA: hypothetical protein [Crassvirales sp.]
MYQSDIGMYQSDITCCITILIIIYTNYIK